MKSVVGEKNKFIECTSKPKKNDFWILGWFGIIFAWIPICPSGLSISARMVCMVRGRTGVGAVTSRLGRWVRDGQAPLAAKMCLMGLSCGREIKVL